MKKVAALLTLILLILPSAVQAQDTSPATEQPLDPPSWSAWNPYAPPAAVDTLQWHWTPVNAQRLGRVPPTRWMVIDPLADDYPAWSPYNYVLGNPLKFIDPNGEYTDYYQNQDGDII